MLARPDGATQVGWRRPVVFHGLTPEQAAFLAGLEDGRAATRAERARWSDLWDALVAHGVTQAVADPRSLDTPRTVRIHDTGPIGVAIAAAAARAGAAVSFPAAGAVGRDGTTRAWRARRALLRAHPAARGVGAEEPCDVDVVVAPGATHPWATALLARDQPHVSVVTDEDGVTVRPVVIPGLTPCGTCADLALAETHQAWPALAAQMAGRTPHVAGAILPVAAALAAHVAVHAGPTGWRVDDDGTVAALTVAAHSGCRCGAAGSVGDDLAARRSRMP